jgi:hypothetical protein
LGYVGKKGGAAGWSLKENPGRLFFQFQLHPKARDSYQGGQFVIEFERSLGESRAGAFSGRARFDQLLTKAELETVLEHHLWLRYRTLDHIRGWLRLISGMLPSILGRARRLDPHVLYLGSEIDLNADPLRPTEPLLITLKPVE